MPEADETRMTIGEHIAELRSRLIKSILALGLGVAVGLYFQNELMTVLIWPHGKVMEMMGRQADTVRFIDLTYTAKFMTYMRVALIAGAILASPIIAYQIWRFIAAGLYKTERRFVLAFAPMSLLLFLGGCAFGYFVLIRYGLYFLASYGSVDLTANQYYLSSYVNFVLLMTLMMGAVFQLPLLMMFFSRVGIVSPKAWSSGRKLAICTIFLVSAILTPPDVFSQIAMAIPLMLLYELGYLLSRLIWRPRQIPATGAAS